MKKTLANYLSKVFFVQLCSLCVQVILCQKQNTLASINPQYCLLNHRFSHSMAMGNLNKSKETTPTTTTASKYIPRRTKISINWNPTFQTSLHKISKVIFFRLSNKIFEIFHFWKFTSQKTSERWDFNLCWFWSS